MNGKVYFLDITNIEYNDNMINDLPDYCKEKLCKVKNVDLKKSRIISWYCLTKILLKEFNIDLCKTNIWENEKGKPYISDIYFNITHTNKYIGIIISDVECGIDIEKIELNIDKEKFAKKILTSEEYLEFARNKEVDFLIKKWTRIETHYKILGEGIALSKLNKNIDSNISTILLDNDYYLSYGPCECKINNINDLNII